MIFEPRAVPAKRVWTWFREGADLLRRKPLQLLALSLIPVSIAALGNTWVRLAAVMLGPLLFAAGVVTAFAADRSTSAIERIVRVDKLTWVKLFAITVAYYAMILVFAAIALAILSHLVAHEAMALPGASLPDPSPFVRSAALFNHFALLHFMWFGPTLLVLVGMPLRLVASQASIAAVRNPVTVLLPLAISLIDQATQPWVGYLWVPVYALVVCAMYVSFRDIWLGQPENQPAVRKQAASAVAAHSM